MNMTYPCVEVISFSEEPLHSGFSGFEQDGASRYPVYLHLTENSVRIIGAPKHYATAMALAQSAAELSDGRVLTIVDNSGYVPPPPRVPTLADRFQDAWDGAWSRLFDAVSAAANAFRRKRRIFR